MLAYAQELRRISLETPLGTDVLLVTAFSGTEELSSLFSYQLDLLSESPAINPKSIVGKNVTLNLPLLDESPRYFNGYVTRFSRQGSDDRFTHYRAEIRPWLWFLTRTTDCRIFQNQSIPQIIRTVLSDHKFGVFEDSQIGGSHPQREYCVQYRETDFAFISRLMEEEGIFFYFRHENGSHTLVLADKKEGYYDCEESTANIFSNASQPKPTDQISAWEHRYEFRSGRFSHNDYNFKMPANPLMASTDTMSKFEGLQNFELYDYPGGHLAQQDAKSFSKLRMEEDELHADVVSAASICRSFSPGGRFMAHADHNADEDGKEFVITSVTHNVSVSGSYSSGSENTKIDYKNTFDCIPASVTFRPSRTTPRPTIHGTQTAMVVGPAGQEIHCDDYSRIKVQFHWDRRGKRNDNSSCWIRTAQLSSGGGFGLFSVPRIGHEVVVSFLEGDPDRPLVIGCVYNAANMPPVSHAGRQPKDGPAPKSATAAKMQMTLRSNSLGGSGGHNEITMNDTGGSEGLFLKAQKDEVHNVGNDRTDTVTNDENRSVGNNQAISVTNDRTDKVGNNETRSVTANRIRTVGGNETITVTGNESVTVNGNGTRTVAGSETQSISGMAMKTVAMSQNETVGVTKTTQTGMAQIDMIGMALAQIIGLERAAVIAGGSDNLIVGMNKTDNVGIAYSVTTGAATTFTAGADFLAGAGSNVGLKAGSSIVIDAPDITLKTKGGFIRINSEGVTISGTKIKLNSGGSPGSLPNAVPMPAAGAAGAAGAGGGGAGSGPASVSGVSNAAGSASGSAGGFAGALSSGSMSGISSILKALPPGLMPPGASGLLGALASGQMPGLGSVLGMLPKGLLPSGLQQAISAVVGSSAGVSTASGGFPGASENPTGLSDVDYLADPSATPTPNSTSPAAGTTASSASNVEYAIDNIMTNEGGYVNNSADRGGPTNYGITLATLQSVQPDATLSDLQNLSTDQARDIYRQNYITGPGIDQLPPEVVGQVADMSANHGPTTAIRLTQRALNASGYNVSEDGVLGSQTRDAVNEALANDGQSFNNAIADQRQNYYNSIVQNNPSQSRFINGWTNRTNSYRVPAN